MAYTISQPEWRDRNETTKYPFEDASTLTNADGDVVLLSDQDRSEWQR